MNERILQLKEQAMEWVPNMADPDTKIRLLNTEKFALSIVRECCLQVADVRIENDFEPVGDAALVQAMTGIKKYFGVE